MRRLDTQARAGRAAISSMRDALRNETGANGTDGLLKVGALATLVVQNSALALVMRFTRTSGEPAQMYIPTTAVVMAEVLKVVVALSVQYKIEGSAGAVLSSIQLNTFGQPAQYLKMGVPALLYTIQNILSYVAASNLDGPTYQIICQSKIPITALLSVVILGKSLASRQWLSLGALTLGVGMVQMSGMQSNAKTQSNSIVGFASAVSLCFCSGLAGVFFELMLKINSSASLWMRNIQLGSFSLLLAALAVIVKDGAAIVERGFFSGYSPMVWVCISLHSLGGLAVAMVVKYADNVVKCFATSISIILSCVLSIALLDMTLSRGFVMGTALVMCATYMYNMTPAEPKEHGAAYHQLASDTDVNGRLEPKEDV